VGLPVPKLARLNSSLSTNLVISAPAAVTLDSAKPSGAVVCQLLGLSSRYVPNRSFLVISLKILIRLFFKLAMILVI